MTVPASYQNHIRYGTGKVKHQFKPDRKQPERINGCEWRRLLQRLSLCILYVFSMQHMTNALISRVFRYAHIELV
jgi:hypothetical protein